MKKLPKRPSNKKPVHKNPPYEVSTEEYLKVKGWVLSEYYLGADELVYVDPITKDTFVSSVATAIAKDRESWSVQKLREYKLLYEFRDFKESTRKSFDALIEEISELKLQVKIKRKGWFR